MWITLEFFRPFIRRSFAAPPKISGQAECPSSHPEVAARADRWVARHPSKAYSSSSIQIYTVFSRYAMSSFKWSALAAHEKWSTGLRPLKRGFATRRWKSAFRFTRALQALHGNEVAASYSPAADASFFFCKKAKNNYEVKTPKKSWTAGRSNTINLKIKNNGTVRILTLPYNATSARAKQWKQNIRHKKQVNNLLWLSPGDIMN